MWPLRPKNYYERPTWPMYRVKDAGKNGIHIAQEASAF